MPSEPSMSCARNPTKPRTMRLRMITPLIGASMAIALVRVVGYLTLRHVTHHSRVSGMNRGGPGRDPVPPTTEEHAMGESEKANNKVDSAVGSAKEKVGGAVGNESLERE